MMLCKLGVCALGATILAATPAFAAVSITNQDSKTHTIVVNHGNSAAKQDIAAGKTVQVNCPDQCGFRDMSFGTSRLAGGNSKLVIDKDGELHFQGGQGDYLMKNGTR